MLKNKKQIILVGTIVCLSLVLALLIGTAFAKLKVQAYTNDKVYTSVDEIPKRKVALVLGCSKTLKDGRRNLYFKYRMQAVGELYQAGKIDFVLVSGDNSRKTYDETTDMKQTLIELGIPEEKIVCDYAGFSTLDSVVRAKKVFLEDSLIVVSQEFHVRRAIYIGQAYGIDLIGYAANDIHGRYAIRTNAREHLARFKTIMDVNILGRKPRFLGETIPIGAETEDISLL